MTTTAGCGGFRALLDDLRMSLLPLAGRGAGTFHPVRVRPSLGFALAPAPIGARRAQAHDAATTLAAAVKRARLLGALLRPASPGAGLVEGSQLDAHPEGAEGRRGMNGLTRYGARCVEDLCQLANEDRGLYGLWTVTLPPDVAASLDSISDGASRWVDVIRRRFGEAHRRACGRQRGSSGAPIASLWWFVVEPQKAGRIHIHFVFRSKLRRGRPWLLGKGQLDRLIRNSFRAITGAAWPCPYAGNVQTIKRSMGRYLSKYLRKGSGNGGAGAVLAGGWSPNMIPRSWWGCSTPARGWLRRYVFELPSVLVAELSLHWRDLAAAGVLEARIWDPPDPAAPSLLIGTWEGADGLRSGVEMLHVLASGCRPTGVVLGRT